MHRVRFALLGLLVACATPPPAPPVAKQPWPGTEVRTTSPAVTAGAPNGGSAASESAPDPASAPQRNVVEEIARLLDRDPKAWAANYPKSDQCEAAARALRGAGSDRAWRGLRACVAKGTFKLLNKLTDGFWDNDLRSQSDASIVLANVIAARGADIVNDVETLQRRRIPLFTLEIAKANPAMYRGRAVIFAAAVENVMPTKGGRATARLALVQLVNVGRRVVVSRDEFDRKYSSSTRRSYSGYGSVSTTRYDNQAEETEEIILGRLETADPFFAPGRRFVVVGRFEGFATPTATPEDPEPEKVPVTSVFAYFEPGAQTALAVE